MRKHLPLLRLVLLAAIPASASAQSSPFTYQGRLLEGGQPANGFYDLRFGVYASLTSGPLAASLVSLSAPVSNGLFTVTLDFGDSVWTGEARWLEISVRANGGASGYAVLSPRQAVSTVPFSSYAGKAGIAADVLGGGAGLTNLSGNNIRAASINSNQLDSATWQTATSTATNVVQAIGDQRYASLNLGRAMLTPYDCGAAGDGITDDTAALQIWLDNASTSNLVAFLPPAHGAYYKITAPIWVRFWNGIKIVGTGGSVQGWPRTTCQIHQATIGSDCLCITNADNIWLESFLVTGELGSLNYTNSSRGIAFCGNNTDSDCCVVTGVGSRGFGSGLWIGSAANISVNSCFISENANGVFLPFNVPNPGGIQGVSVLNNMYFQTCQFSYNYSNDVFVANGSSVFDTCDIAPIYAGSVALRLQDHGSVTFRNSRVEAWWTSRPRMVVTCTNMGDCTLTLDGAEIGGSAVDPSFESYSLILSNSFCVIRNSGLYAGATDGLPVLEYNGPYWIGSSGITCDHPMSEKFYLNGVPYLRQIGGANLQTVYGTTPIYSPGQLQFRQHSRTYDKNGNDMGGWDDTWSLEVSARLSGPPFSDPYVRVYDLLAYAKDKQELATFNNLSGRHIFGANDMPPSIAAGPGAGQSAAISLDSRATDAAATVALDCGASPVAGSALWTLTFGTPYSWPPHVVASPANANAAEVKSYVTATTTNCCLSLVAGQGLGVAATYSWNVIVLGQ